MIPPYLFIPNLFHANTETDQIQTLPNLNMILENVKDIQNKNLISGGNFSITFDTTLELLGGNPILTKKAFPN